MIRVQTIFPRPQFNNFSRATVRLRSEILTVGWVEWQWVDVNGKHEAVVGGDPLMAVGEM